MHDDDRPESRCRFHRPPSTSRRARRRRPPRLRDHSGCRGPHRRRAQAERGHALPIDSADARAGAARRDRQTPRAGVRRRAAPLLSDHDLRHGGGESRGRRLALLRMARARGLAPGVVMRAYRTLLHPFPRSATSAARDVRCSRGGGATRPARRADAVADDGGGRRVQRRGGTRRHPSAGPAVYRPHARALARIRADGRPHRQPGIGATTAASVTDFVLIRPLPFPDADRLVKLWQKQPGYADGVVAGELSRLEDGSRVVRAHRRLHGASRQHRRPERAAARRRRPRDGGSPLPTRIQPALGRVFRPEDDRQGAPGRSSSATNSGALVRRRPVHPRAACDPRRSAG